MLWFKNKQPETVQFPTTPEGLDSFVAQIVKEYGLPDTDDTYDNIATMIMHVPASCCKAPLSYFGESVLKSMANKVAFEKLREFKQKRDAKAKADEAAKKLTLVQASDNQTTQPATQPTSNGAGTLPVA